MFGVLLFYYLVYEILDEDLVAALESIGQVVEVQDLTAEEIVLL